MEEQTTAQLIEINRRFYSQFGDAFSVTRQRIQDGVARVLAGLPDEGVWLDLGCGNGGLALEWLARGRQSAYHGLDFSAELLAAGQKSVDGWFAQSGKGNGAGSGQIRLTQADLSSDAWAKSMLRAAYQGVMAFAVLHHIPSAALRIRILNQVRELLIPGGWFLHSEWQFQHSPKLMARRQPWSLVGLDENRLEAGDTLLDWRFGLQGQPQQVGLRYVHLFGRDELAGLAEACQFDIVDEFESDGQNGRSGLYQVWKIR